MHIINMITDDGLSIYHTVRPRGVKNYLLIMCQFLLKKLSEQKNVVKNEITLFLAYRCMSEFFGSETMLSHHSKNG